MHLTPRIIHIYILHDTLGLPSNSKGVGDTNYIKYFMPRNCCAKDVNRQ